MKKLSLFLFLVLLIGCSNKVENALENCADDKLLLYDEKDEKNGYSYAGMIISNFGKLDQADDMIKRSWELASSLSEKKEKEFYPWVSENLKYGANGYEVIIHEGTVEALLPIGHSAISEYKDKIMKQYRAKKGFYDLNEPNVVFLRKSGYDLYEMYGSRIVKKASLNKKMKHPTYVNFFTKCEKEYNETPNAFLLKWK